MSHNLLKVENQTPNVNGEVDLNASNIGSFTSASSKFLGVDASGNLVQSDAPTLSGSLNWTPVAHYFAFLTNWGSVSGTVSVNDTLFIRLLSGTLYQNSSFVSVTYDGAANATWANRYTLQAGTYLFNYNFIGRVSTSSDEVIVRLKNITDGTLHGNSCSWGSAKFSSNGYAYLNLDSAKSFNIIVTSVSGSALRFNTTALLSTHLNIWKL